MRLLLLRKYGSYNESVNIKNVINSVINKYPKEKEKFEAILNDYNSIEKQDFKYILSNGKELNLYKTIENTMYGLYLHADYEKICDLLQAKEDLRFVSIRKYVEEFETIVFILYDYISDLEKDYVEYQNKEKATIIYLGDTLNKKQQIKKSPYLVKSLRKRWVN